MQTETTCRWLVALSDLQIALGLDSKEEICQKLGIPGALWETPEPHFEFRSGDWRHITVQPEVHHASKFGDGLGEHLSLYERAIFSSEETAGETDFAVRLYLPIFNETPTAIKALGELGVHLEPLDAEWEPPDEMEDLIGYIQRTQNEIIMEEESVRKLCELAGISIPDGVSACKAFNENDNALAQANDWCQQQFGSILSSNIIECSDYDDGENLPSLYLDRHALSPLIGVDQQIRFTPLGQTITRLGITPIRTTCAVVSTEKSHP